MEILPADIEGFKLFRKNQVSGSTVNLPSQADVQPSHRLGTLSRSESREESEVLPGINPGPCSPRGRRKEASSERDPVHSGVARFDR